MMGAITDKVRTVHADPQHIHVSQGRAAAEPAATLRAAAAAASSVIGFSSF